MSYKIQTRVIRVIRMTDELKGMLDATAAKCNLTVAEVLRVIAVGIRNGRPAPAVAETENFKSATAAGSVVVNIESGITIPDMYNAYALRRAIYLRCAEELARPERRKSAPPEAVEGVDYNVPDGVAAAKLGLI